MTLQWNYLEVNLMPDHKGTVSHHVVSGLQDCTWPRQRSHPQGQGPVRHEVPTECLWFDSQLVGLSLAPQLTLNPHPAHSPHWGRKGSGEGPQGPVTWLGKGHTQLLQYAQIVLLTLCQCVWVCMRVYSMWLCTVGILRFRLNPYSLWYCGLHHTFFKQCLVSRH